MTGPAASTTVTMEGTAGAGEIVVGGDTARARRRGVVGDAKGAGYLLHRAPAVPGDAFVPFETVDPHVELVQGISVGLRDALASTRRDSEHRRVTVAFVHFDGTDALIEGEGPAATADRLDVLISTVQRAAEPSSAPTPTPPSRTSPPVSRLPTRRCPSTRPPAPARPR